MIEKIMTLLPDIEGMTYYVSEPVRKYPNRKNVKKVPELAKGQYLHTNRQGGPYKGSQQVGRNETCPCNSGKKFKQCCINKKSEDNDGSSNIS